MTKPHTTLSEAVRALESNDDDYAYRQGFERARDRAAALVEQHEAQEPFGRFHTKKNFDGSTWTFQTHDADPDSFPLYAQPTLAATPVTYCGRPGTGECSCRKFASDPTNCERRLEEVTTLAATQAGDAKDAARYRWLRERDWFDGELCVLRDPKKVLASGAGLGADCPSRDRLDDAIDAAMSPTTTRSE